MPDILLGSSSPRRQELVKGLGRVVGVVSPNVDENVEIDDSYPLPVARTKMSVMPYVANVVIICADTIVKLENRIFNKPTDYDDAFSMLTALRGKRHQVLTAVCLRYNDKYSEMIVESGVVFKNYSDDQLRSYLDLGEYIDKSGGYACQGLGKEIIIERIDGDVDNVIGLPCAAIKKEFVKMGISD